MIKSNNVNHLVELKHCLSTKLDLNDQRADVLVTEIFDAGLLGK